MCFQTIISSCDHTAGAFFIQKFPFLFIQKVTHIKNEVNEQIIVRRTKANKKDDRNG